MGQISRTEREDKGFNVDCDLQERKETRARGTECSGSKGSLKLDRDACPTNPNAASTKRFRKFFASFGQATVI